jgi:hypothetical protein
MLDAFYGAFSPACFALLGLWLVIVQQRAKDLEHNGGLQRQAYAVALSFALPGMMGVLALVDTADAEYWRTSFAVVALAGVVILAAVHGLPGRAGVREAAGLLTVLLYLAVAGLAIFVGGAAALRTEAILLTGLIFLGFNVAWLALFAPMPRARDTAARESRAAAG